MKTKKGFTLAEMSVALAVIAIATSMIALCFVSIKNFSKTKQTQADITAEIQDFKKTFGAEFQKYQSPEYILVQNAGFSNTVNLTQNAQNIQISFNPNQKTLNANQQILQTYELITNAQFKTTQNLVYCTLETKTQTTTLVFAKFA